MWGFDEKGNELFWTTIGGNITCIAICDVDDDKKNKILIGSEDTEIKIFRKDMLVGEVIEGDSVSYIGTISEGFFGYSLINGTFGLFKGKSRLWRIKSKTSIVSFALFPDEKSVACIFTNGKIDIRSINNGDVMHKISLDTTVTNAFVAKIIEDETDQLTIVTKEGRVIGYKFKDSNTITNDRTQQMLREYTMKKTNLLKELNHYDRKSTDECPLGFKIIKDSHLTCFFTADMKDGLLLHVNMENTDVIIKSVIMFGEGIFPGESCIIHPNEDLSNNIQIPIKLSKEIALELHLKVMIGGSYDNQFQIIEVTKRLPKFASLVNYEGDNIVPTSKVEFKFGAKKRSLKSWFEENFLETVTIEDDTLVKKLYNLRTKEPLIIRTDGDSSFTIQHNDIKLAGDIIQTIGEYYRLKNLKSVAYYPTEFEKLQKMFEGIEECYEVQKQFTAEFAQKVSMTKECVIRGEDALHFHHLDLKMSSRLLLVLSIIFLIFPLSIACSKSKDSLVFVQAVWRHGSRAPGKKPYPNDIHDENAWPNGWEQLTSKGMQQMKTLGAFFKKRYIDSFVDETFSQKEIFIRSSDSPRALVSATAFVNGMFPKDKNTPHGLPSQIAPIHAPFPDDNDPLLKATSFECPEYDKEADEINENLYSSIEKNYTEFFQFLGNVTGFGSEITLKNVVGLSNIQSEIDYDLEQPDWVYKKWPEYDNNSTMDVVNEIKRLVRLSEFNNDKLAKFRGGYLLGNWLSNINKIATNSTTASRKMILYSSHDGTLLSLMAALNLNPNSLIPYTGCIIMEVHKSEDDTPYVKLYYKTPDEFTKLTIPGCSDTCTVNEFNNLYFDRSIMTKKELFSDCARTYCDAEDGGIFDYID
uniref:ER membrane protein complex subunit 1 n=1 Tax=Parastrongyloides trichosuri TaxID=131310 RepID=A0A0N5A3K0_PARTI